MTLELSPLSQIFTDDLKACPQAACISKNDEVFFLDSKKKCIYVKQLPENKLTYLLEINKDTYLDMWYIDSTDTIVLMEKNPLTSQTLFKAVTNWRDNNSDTSKVAPVIVFPDTIQNPTAWQFTQSQISKNGPTIYLLASFEVDLNPAATTYQNSIFIASEKTCMIWDFFKLPRFRCLISIPVQHSVPLFSFYENYVAFIISSTLFILSIKPGEVSNESHPFSPENCCLEYSDQLTINSGFESSNGFNFVFGINTLQNSPYHIEIVLSFRTPDSAHYLQFINGGALIVLSESFQIAVSAKDNGYDPVTFTDAAGSLSCSANEEYCLLYGKQELHVLPNPTLSGVDYGTIRISPLSVQQKASIQFCLINENYLMIISGARKNITMSAYKIKDVGAISEQLRKSEDPYSVIMGTRLMRRGSKGIAAALMRAADMIGRDSAKKKEAVSMYVSAFNADAGESMRTKIIDIVTSMSQRTAKAAVEKMQFRYGDINDKVLPFVMSLTPDQAAQKLLNGGVFGKHLEGNTDMIKLYKGVSAAFESDHETAQTVLKTIPPAILKEFLESKNLDDSNVDLISEDIGASMLVSIGRPELHNHEWRTAERIAAHRYMEGDYAGVIEQLSTLADAELHTDEWPVPPSLASWLIGSDAERIVASIAARSDAGGRWRGGFEDIIDGVEKMRRKDFIGGMRALEGRAVIADFLRAFVGDGEWGELYRAGDDEVKGLIEHIVLNIPPGKSFNAALMSLPQTQELKQAEEILKDTDRQLLLAAAPVEIM